MNIKLAIFQFTTLGETTLGQQITHLTCLKSFWGFRVGNPLLETILFTTKFIGQQKVPFRNMIEDLMSQQIGKLWKEKKEKWSFPLYIGDR